MPELTPAEEDALTTAVGAVRGLSRHTAANILLIGTHLLNARAVLGQHRFPAWVQEKFAWTLRDVAGMIRVAHAFASVPKPTLDRCDPTALLVLAERGTPPAVRESALACAAEGGRVTAQTARHLIRLARGRGTAANGKADRVAPADRPAAEDRTAETMGWAAVERLVAEGAAVRLVRLDDAEENDDAVQPWACYVYKGGVAAGPFVSKDSLAGAVTLAAGTQPEQVCRSCGRKRHLFEGFSRKSGNPFGRSFNCRRCETDRVGYQKKMKRGTFKDGDWTPDRLPAPAPKVPSAKGSPAAPPAARRTPPAG